LAVCAHAADYRYALALLNSLDLKFVAAVLDFAIVGLKLINVIAGLVRLVHRLRLSS
jgi:hypothetical protein